MRSGLSKLGLFAIVNTDLRNTTKFSESLPAFSDDGVDLTLIRWMLSLTADERLQQLEDHAAFAQDLRDANTTIQLPKYS